MTSLVCRYDVTGLSRGGRLFAGLLRHLVFGDLEGGDQRGQLQGLCAAAAQVVLNLTQTVEHVTLGRRRQVDCERKGKAAQRGR